MNAAIWPGTWVTERLGVRLVDAGGGPRVADLAGLAVRRNPRRAHLVVSQVLGKHVPADPHTIYAAGRLLGLRAGAVLGAEDPGDDWDIWGPEEDFQEVKLPGGPPLVVGYAETATSLGHVVADSFADADYLHSTRRAVPGVALLGRFDEAHSHATEHLLLPADPAWLERDGPLILVDDELTTGRTAQATIRELHAVRPRERYVVAALLDLRPAADRPGFAALGEELGTRIDVASLAAGEVDLPADVLARSRDLVATLDAPQPPGAPGSATVTRIDAGWPAGLPEGGRHGFAAVHRPALLETADRLAGQVAEGLPGDARVLVLGSEELMYAPLLLARALARLRPGTVRFSSTTRSPVLPVDDPGYAIRTRLTFPAHDGVDTGTPRYAYNVAGFDHIVLVVDRTGGTPALWEDRGLVAALRGVCQGVTVVVIPDLRPAVTPATETAGR
ncbi:phosphoribosyltransferase family protein [Dactylosporangium sp. NBC_01737]|uniref:phosphoribosyltransferase family protein n=1 Tax=Dactylosporangium sp. NBC_01737 TaxID=2975959 RepID=UPI002E12141E|nr:phosphoribosyltransferase family protein [Dactylosporangium sp. NBC_01737]